jgi:hypothetical protein
MSQIGLVNLDVTTTGVTQQCNRRVCPAVTGAAAVADPKLCEEIEARLRLVSNARSEVTGPICGSMPPTETVRRGDRPVWCPHHRSWC